MSRSTQPAQKTEKDAGVLPPNDPFVPPKGDVCFINDLPPELLCHIFKFSSAYDDSVPEPDLTDYWDKVCLFLGQRTRSEGEDEDEDEGEDDDDGEDESEDNDEGRGEDKDKDEGAEGEDQEEAEAEAEEEEERKDEEGDEDPTAPAQVLYRLVISHVCRHWRNVAFSNPSLWTDIEVCPVAGQSYELESMLLERSKNLPIDVRIDCLVHEIAYDAEPPSDADLRPLVSMLTPHIHRWRTMDINVAEYNMMYVFLSAVSDPSTPAATQLTTLELYDDGRRDREEFDNFGHPSMPKHVTLFGGSAPLLTTLVLWGVHVDWSQPWIASASNLTDLKLAFHPEDVRPSWAQFATILRGASTLKKFSLHQSGPSGDPAEWFIEPTPGSSADLNAPVQLARATNFVLAFHSQARAIGLLRKFYLPALKNIVLELSNGDYTDFVHELARPTTSLSLSSVQERPSSLLSRLESLKLAGLPCDIECVETLYGKLQNLTSLTIVMENLRSLFLDILGTPCSLTGQSDVWLPQLATLYVSGASGEALREVVQKRMGAGVPLSSLYVKKYSQLFKKDVEWFRENLETFEFCDGL